MIEIVKIINGVKQLVPLTTDSGQGTPLGSLITVYGNHTPNGYLPMETPFDPAQYPALYTLLGTAVTPDTPCDLGADWSNAQSITFSTSDTTITEDGWLAGRFSGPVNSTEYTLSLNGIKVASSYNNGNNAWEGMVQIRVNKGDKVKMNASGSFQYLYFVPFKKYARVVIKAVIGPIEDSAADQVVQNINNSRSYSTEEVNTGKKWIDGKPIYRKVLLCTATSTLPNSWVSISGWSINKADLNIDKIISYGGFIGDFIGAFTIKTNVSPIQFATIYGSTISVAVGNPLILEYTKTTD